MNKKSRLVLLVVIILISAITVAIIYQRTNDSTESGTDTTETKLRSQSYEFVQKYGTYTAETYQERVSELKPLVTEEYSRQSFIDDQVTQKQQDIQGIIETTVTDDYNEGSVKINGSEAKVSLNATETISINGEDISEPVDYTIWYTLQDGNWMVSNVKIDRDS